MDFWSLVKSTFMYQTDIPTYVRMYSALESWKSATTALPKTEVVRRNPFSWRLPFPTVTLIATAISRYGVIHAADSNLTDPATGESSKGQKVFGLGFMNGGLAIAGTYDIEGKPMDTWMPAFINACGKPTLRGFAKSLAERLTQVVGDSRLLLVHIAGYVDEGDTAHPELFFVRNFRTIDPINGAYVGRLSAFQLSEDFWNRDFKNAGCIRRLQAVATNNTSMAILRDGSLT